MIKETDDIYCNENQQSMLVDAENYLLGKNAVL